MKSSFEFGHTIHRRLTLQATFKITLDVPSDLTALSNMPVIEERINGNIKTVSYEESPIMSTYLVAVVVGLFDFVEDHTSDGNIMHPIGTGVCISHIILNAVQHLYRG